MVIKDFILDRKFKNLSNYTIDNYSRNLRIFEEYCSTQNVYDIRDVKKGLIVEFLNHCKELGNIQSTVNNKIRTLKAMFNFAKDEEIIEYSPMFKIKQSKEITRIDVPSDQEVKQLVKYWERKGYKYGDFQATRNRMLIIFFISTGTRLQEAKNLRWRDIDFDNYTIYVFGKKRQIENVPMTIKLKKELMEYQTFCTRKFNKLSDYVFTTSWGKQLADDSISSLFKRMKNDLNPNYRLSCHTLRHYYCHKAIKGGLSTYVVKNLMRHESIQQTEKYHALWNTDMRDEVEKFNPLNNLDL